MIPLWNMELYDRIISTLMIGISELLTGVIIWCLWYSCCAMTLQVKFYSPAYFSSNMFKLWTQCLNLPFLILFDYLMVVRALNKSPLLSIFSDPGDQQFRLRNLFECGIKSSGRFHSVNCVHGLVINLVTYFVSSHYRSFQRFDGSILRLL